MKGYNRLAALLGTRCELGMFRRFLPQRAHDLLLMQAEILEVEADVQSYYEECNESGDASLAQFDVWVKMVKEAQADPRGGFVWHKLMERRQLLKDYGEMQLQYRQLAILPPPKFANVKAFQDWMEQPDGGNNFLQERESTTWSKPFEQDLTCLSSIQEDRDLLSDWVCNRFIPWFHDTIYHRHKPLVTIPDLSKMEKGSLIETPIHEYEDNVIQRFTDIVSTMLASLLPTLPMFALYFIKSPLVQIATIVGLTFVFSGALMFVSKAKRTECFAASAAFAAVQVVFVGYNKGGIGSNGNCSCSP